MEPAEVERTIQNVATELRASAVDSAPLWAERAIATTIAVQGLPAPDPDTVERTVQQVVAQVDAGLGALLDADIDAQRTTPLAVFRSATAPMTELLERCGAQPVPVPAGDPVRPGDPFALAPASLADLGPDVHEAGIMWGAAKAAVHLQRRRAEGQL